MNRRKAGFAFIIIVLVAGIGIAFGPALIEHGIENYQNTHYQLNISSPDMERVTIYLCEDNRVFLNPLTEENNPRYLVCYPDVLTGLIEKVMNKDAISYIRITEQVSLGGFMEIVKSPAYKFTYTSLYDNGGYVSINLNATNILLQILDWE